MQRGREGAARQGQGVEVGKCKETSGDVRRPGWVITGSVRCSLL